MNFKENWRVITHDQWILQVISGCPLVFLKQPPLRTRHFTSQTHQLTREQQIIMEAEVESLLEKRAIHRVPTKFQSPGFYSTIFVVPKKDGGWRPIINLKSLNQYLEVPHFKMESIQSLKDVILPGDYLAKIDLKDAYLSVPMNAQAHPYLRFMWREDVFEFSSLPFGLAPAPLIFTKLLRPVAAFLRGQGVRLIIYLDDILLMASTPMLLRNHISLTSHVLTHLGFILNQAKCVLEPQQSLDFLGFLIDSRTMTIALPQSKVDKIRKECRHMSNQQTVTARQLAHLIGAMTACLPAIAAAPLHYRALQSLRSLALRSSMTDYDSQVHLSAEAKADLHWWIDHLTSQMCRPIHPPVASLTLETDASTIGWGAYCQETNQRTGGPWTGKEATHHINWLELKAAFLAVQSFVKQTNCHVLLLMDNRVAISYINRKGGTCSHKLCQLALDLWGWCMDHDITLHAEHLPGKLNVIADFESRHMSDGSDWQLDVEIFSQLQQIHGPFSVDLFASFRNAQLKVFYSWKADPQATAVDALVQDWSNHRPYCFPPFVLIGRCLQKIRNDNVQFAIMIAPIWPAQTWYPLLLSSLIDHPQIIPSHPNLLKNPQGESHPLVLQDHLHLAAWPISGNPSRRKEFLSSLPPSYVHHGEKTPPRLTNQLGEGGLAGVLQGRKILFLQL